MTLSSSPIHATDEEIMAFNLSIKNVQGGFSGTYNQLEKFLRHLAN